jgi:hypothetical protein
MSLSNEVVNELKVVFTSEEKVSPRYAIRELKPSADTYLGETGSSSCAET